ncbi:hypothetical protein [Burkholderia sp. BE17]|uniref:hypothetical protein n=1 Tax=Burkholderia sp. BE17 TaxID=2656644 RepID=UPI001D125055|nr:hypothetical protein [Burkholderia sp. BE17]
MHIITAVLHGLMCSTSAGKQAVRVAASLVQPAVSQRRYPGAEAGAAVGAIGGPLGVVFGGLTGALIAGLLGSTAGSIAGSTVGGILDDSLLENYWGLSCGHTFGTQYR